MSALQPNNYREFVATADLFHHPRYPGAAWWNHRLHWSEEDERILIAAADLGISPTATANTLGRPPTNCAHQALHLGIRIPRRWLELVRKPRQKVGPRIDLQYPYIVKPTDEHADLIAVNRLVAQAMPGREDLCQDIMLALWESRTSLAELRTDPKALKAFVRAARKKIFERGGYGVESMDVTLHSEDGDGKSKYEDARYQRTLVDNDDQFIEDAMFGKRYSHDFSDRAIADLSNEEEEIGIPAALWTRIEMAS